MKNSKIVHTSCGMALCLINMVKNEISHGKKVTFVTAELSSALLKVK